MEQNIPKEAFLAMQETRQEKPRKQIMNDVNDVISKHEYALNSILASKAMFDIEFEHRLVDIKKELSYGFNAGLEISLGIKSFLGLVKDTKVRDTLAVTEYVQYVDDLKAWLAGSQSNVAQAEEAYERVEILEKQLKAEKEQVMELKQIIKGMEEEIKRGTNP